MENSFFVGIVHHKKRMFKPEYSEKIVLYKATDYYYIDLVRDVIYSTNSEDKDYVDECSLIPTDISMYKEDYQYLLSKHNCDVMIRKKKKINFR